MTVNGQSLTDGILTQAAHDPAYRARASKTVSGWSRAIAAGKTPQLGNLSQLPRDQQLAQLNSLELTLGSGAAITAPAQPSPQTVKRQATPAQPAGSVGGSVTPGGVIPNAVNPDDPNSFAVRGQPGGTDLTYWLDIQLIIADSFCAFSCAETDRFTSRVTVSPGAISSLVSSTNIYNPNNGNFSGAALTLWSINRGNITRSEKFPGPGADEQQGFSNAYALNGTQLTVAAMLEIYAEPNNQYIYDGGKTADATCRVTDNNCVYAP